MKRKLTKQSPGPTAIEKRFLAWTKESDCIVCGREGPSIVHHCYGSTRKERVGVIKVNIGNVAVIPLCQEHDDVITHESRRAFIDKFGPQCEHWVAHALMFPEAEDLDALKVLAIAGCRE